MTLFELNNKVQDFDIETELDKIIKDNEHVFVDANTEMLYSGIDSEGNSLGEYSPKTIDYKLKPGDHDHKIDNITLKDLGDFYSGKSIIKENRDWTIISKDWKQEKLETDFGKAINGIDKERTAEITDDILTPNITKALQNAIS